MVPVLCHSQICHGSSSNLRTPSTALAPAGSLRVSPQSLGRGLPHAGRLQIKFTCPVQRKDQRSISEAAGEALQLPGKAALATAPLLLAVTLASVLLMQDQLYRSCYGPLNGQGKGYKWPLCQPFYNPL